MCVIYIILKLAFFHIGHLLKTRKISIDQFILQVLVNV